jgi:hypothetical protein
VAWRAAAFDASPHGLGRGSAAGELVVCTPELSTERWGPTEEELGEAEPLFDPEFEELWLALGIQG